MVTGGAVLSVLTSKIAQHEGKGSAAQHVILPQDALEEKINL